jgi:hypothetical protein
MVFCFTSHIENWFKPACCEVLAPNSTSVDMKRRFCGRYRYLALPARDNHRRELVAASDAQSLVKMSDSLERSLLAKREIQPIYQVAEECVPLLLSGHLRYDCWGWCR